MVTRRSNRQEEYYHDVRMMTPFLPTTEWAVVTTTGSRVMRSHRPHLCTLI